VRPGKWRLESWAVIVWVGVAVVGLAVLEIWEPSAAEGNERTRQSMEAGLMAIIYAIGWFVVFVVLAGVWVAARFQGLVFTRPPGRQERTQMSGGDYFTGAVIILLGVLALLWFSRDPFS
jgi:hypothetical protein